MWRPWAAAIGGIGLSIIETRIKVKEAKYRHMDWGEEVETSGAADQLVVSRRRVMKYVLYLVEFIDFLKILWYNIYVKWEKQKRNRKRVWSRESTPVTLRPQ